MKPDIYGAPAENFARGLREVDIPELGERSQGKVRDIWRLDGRLRLMVTTDRLSAFDRRICTVPGKGQVLNLLSGHWFRETADIIPNHVIDIPHPNVVVVRESVRALPIEVVLRRYMADSSSKTSVSRQYREGKRTIYGLQFPDGLRSNQEFPMGTILTPTTKSGDHDLPLTNDEAREIVDGQISTGSWERIVEAAQAIFERGRITCAKAGLILVDTKYEFGIGDDKLMLIDELHTPDSSRFWKADSYQDHFDRDEPPEIFDKEIIRKWLADHDFTGEGRVPVVPPEIIDQVSAAYQVPYRMITGKDLLLQATDPVAIRQRTLDYLGRDR